MTFVTRRLEWDSAHRVLRHESKCSTLHGHRYVALVTCIADELDACGRVVDFGVVKERVGGWIDANWDHTTLVNENDFALRDFCEVDSETNGKRPAYRFVGEPTAENIARELLIRATVLLDNTRFEVYSVEVFETPNCSAKVYTEEGLP